MERKGHIEYVNPEDSPVLVVTGETPFPYMIQPHSLLDGKVLSVVETHWTGIVFSSGGCLRFQVFEIQIPRSCGHPQCATQFRMNLN